MRAIAAALLCCWMLPAAAGGDLDEPRVLVAAPGAGVRAVGRIVVVVAPAGEGQHLGFVINRPSDVTLAKVFPDHAPSQKVVDPVYEGGPVRQEMIFALVQRRESPGAGSLHLMPGLYAAYGASVVDRVIEADPEHARFVAGLVAWQPGELQSEVEGGLWLVLEADPALVMRKPETLWGEMLLRWQQRGNSI